MVTLSVPTVLLGLCFPVTRGAPAAVQSSEQDPGPGELEARCRIAR